VDYVIEFARGIDNLIGYHDELSRLNRPAVTELSKRLDFYFDVFLQSIKKVKIHDYIKEIERYNDCVNKEGERAERAFFSDVRKKYPEFDAIFKKSLKEKPEHKIDPIQYLIEHSDFLKKDENEWMRSVMEVVRNTSVFFQPQIRTKIMNEGWASYWHEKLFLQDDRIKGHEVDFARAHAGVASLPRVGLNPYALGMHLFYYIEEVADKGKYSIEFKRLLDADKREKFDAETGQGQDFIFKVRENSCDFLFVNTFVDQDFVTRNKLFVTGRRMNQAKMVWEFYVKSRKAEDYRKMLLDTLYHPPHIEIDPEKGKDNTLYLVHRFEEKPLVKEFIANTMMGIEYLWGGPVQLETSDVVPTPPPKEETKEPEIKWQRVLYSMENRKLSKRNI
jgi:stage V sporulation protein R